MRVLVVEDNRFDQRLLEKVLNDCGLDLQICDNAEDAWELYQQDPFPLVMLDWVLPGMSGLDVCQKIRTCPESEYSLILVITSRSSAQDLQAVLDAGANDYLSKPIDINLLKIRLTIAQRQIYEMQQRRSAEEDLLENEARFQQIAENINGVFWLFSKSREHIIYVNPAYERVWGRTLASLYKDPGSWLDGVHPEDRERVISVFLHETGWHEVEEEYRVVHVDGSVRWVRDRSFPICDDTGKVYRTASIVEDITEQRHATELQHRLLTAIEQVAEMIMITDPDGRIQYINPAYLQVTGFKKSALIGTVPKFLHPDNPDGLSLDLWKTLHRGQVWRKQFIDDNADGSSFHNQAIVSPVLNDHGQIVNYVAVMRDVTQDLAAEENLRNTQKMEAIGTLAGGIAHDFNNLLTPILGNVSMVLDDLPSDSEDAELLGEALRAGRDAAALVKEILAFGRRTSITLRPINLTDQIHDIIAMARGTFDRKIEFDVSLSDSVGAVMSDAVSFKQIVLNLMINARDALEEEWRKDASFRPRISISLISRCVDPEFCRAHPGAQVGTEYAVLTVADNGPGMDPKTQAHVFDPFYTTKDVGKGTGLGLASVYGIVQQHHGFVACSSTLGKGAVFEVFLPMAMKEEISSADELPTTPPPKGTETILIVDDEESVRGLLSKLLMRNGYQVLEACDGKEALEIYQEQHDDIGVIVLDLMMPVMSGYQLLIHLRDFAPNAKVIISSGHSEEVDLKEIGDLPVQGVLHKPYVPEEMLRMVRKVLDMSSPTG